MKKIVFKLLCNPIIGKLITVLFGYNIPNIRDSWNRYLTPKDYCTDTVRAMIFWGFYESAEIRLIKKHLVADLPVIELGASLGVLSAIASKRINESSKYTCIEANPYLIEYIEKNIIKHNNRTNLKILNSALVYNKGSNITFHISNNNTESSFQNDNILDKNSISIKTLGLNSIIENDFTLICDIEGAEIDLLLNDKSAFDKCRHLIIELHKTKSEGKLFEIPELNDLIINTLGFRLIESDGNVFYYVKE